MATAKKQNPKKLSAGEFYGYGVDAGTGCFVDTKVRKQLEEEKTGDAIFGALDKTRVDTWAWANVKLGDANVVAFSSGWGDGFYPSFWGFDAKGDVVALVTDFEMLTEPIEETVIFPLKGPFKHPKMKPCGVTLAALKGKPLGFRLRGDAALSLATAKGKLVPASSERKYGDNVQSIVFTPRKPATDIHLALRLTLGFKPIERV